jgi:DHA1 family bicyclomycin/chloramphenicol resistance-like MFS transporter
MTDTILQSLLRGRMLASVAGTASAMLGSIQMAWGAVCSILVGLLFDGTPFTMAIIIFSCAAIANTILFGVGRKIIER